MSVRGIERLLEQWEMGVKDVHRRVILSPTPRERENQALRDRLSRLSQASINESLDFDNVLQDFVDSAHALTGARYGGITTIDSSG